AALRARPLDERTPYAGAHEAGAEPIAQPGLEPDVLRGLGQRRVGDVRRPLREHALLVAREPIAPALREPEQNRADLALRLLGALLASAVRHSFWQVDRLVDDAEVFGV